MDSSPTATAPSQTEPAKKGRPFAVLLPQILALLVVLMPAAGAFWLVHEYVVNTPHYDDLTFLEDWIKFKKGGADGLTVGDLFSVHLEHRVTVPRLMALGAHLLVRSDLRWHNIMTLVLLLGVLWNLMVIWRRSTGETLRSSWFPLLLISSVLFCAVQWQTLLWPILFEIVVPIYAFTLMLRLWTSSMNPWTALPLSLLLAGICILSFGNGPIVLLLIPLCIVFQRPDLDVGTRRKLLLAWLVCAAIGLALHFTDFHNAAPVQFAYGYDDKMTAADTIKAFILSPKLTAMDKVMKAFDFTMAVLGGHLCRGLNMSNLVAAQWLGLFSVALFAAAVIWLFVRRQNRELLKNAAPWIMLGLYSIGTAVLIMLGRAARTISGTIAILPRYMTHSVPLTLALIALFWILGHRLTPRWRTRGGVMGGAFLLLMGVEWIYGAQRMELWQQARLQGKALLMFSNVFAPHGYLGQVSGDGEYGAGVMKDLDDIGQSPVPLLKSRLLSQFHVSSHTLFHRQGGFETLNLTDKGGLEAHGFAEITGQRAADLILFTTKNSQGEDEIFGLESLERFPFDWNSATAKDNDWCSQPTVKADYYARWEGPVNLFQNKLPPAGAKISAWALDVEKNYVYAIQDHRTAQDPQPPLPKRPTDGELNHDDDAAFVRTH